MSRLVALFRIYSLKGTTVTDIPLKPGVNTIVWDKTGVRGSTISTGTYIVSLVEKTNRVAGAAVKVTITK